MSQTDLNETTVAVPQSPWETPELVKVDISTYTLNNTGAGSDGGLPGTNSTS